MTVSVDVINDLLPLYAANECSADSRRLVEEHLKAHPELAAGMAVAMRSVLRNPLPVGAGDTEERRALARTQRLLRLRSWFMALAGFFMLLPFSFIVSNGTFRWLLAESPGHVAVYEAIGAVLWVAYFVTRRKLRHSW
ncbi:MAG: zf-HC2 domain-containing protein [Ignavibacteriae bacterium]|nr:zf-HC2 domain-containing protein [Ignavibacteriota bacterium]